MDPGLEQNDGNVEPTEVFELPTEVDADQIPDDGDDGMFDDCDLPPVTGGSATPGAHDLAEEGITTCTTHPVLRWYRHAFGLLPTPPSLADFTAMYNEWKASGGQDDMYDTVEAAWTMLSLENHESWRCPEVPFVAPGKESCKGSGKSRMNQATPNTAAVPKIRKKQKVEAADEEPDITIQLTCERCKEPTDMTNSIEASSKNPMKRKCKGCNSADNQRNYAARHNPQVKKDYQILSPKSKVKYYVSGKRKWENSEKQRKVKSEMKVSAQISERTSEVARGLEEDVYEPFENFAVRKIILKEAADKAGAWILFQKELEAGHPAMMKRGVWCLGRFKGFKVQSGTETSLDTNKSQKRKIESTEDIEEFNKEAQRLRKKVRRISAVHYLQVDGSYHTMEGEKELHPSKVEGQVTFELKDADTSTLDGSSLLWKLIVILQEIIA